MDFSAVFPKSKIKSQILEDEDVGNLTTKAIELIGACSALLIDDLVRSDDDGNDDSEPPQGEDVPPPPSSRAGRAEARAARTGRRRTPEAATSEPRIASDAPASASDAVAIAESTAGGEPAGVRVVDLASILAKIRQRREYEFLRECIDGATENGAPAYDADRVKRMKRRRSYATAKRRKVEKEDRDRCSEVKLPPDLKGGDGDDGALRDAVSEAQSATTGGGDGIVEDDEDYD